MKSCWELQFHLIVKGPRQLFMTLNFCLYRLCAQGSISLPLCFVCARTRLVDCFWSKVFFIRFLNRTLISVAQKCSAPSLVLIKINEELVMITFNTIIWGSSEGRFDSLEDSYWMTTKSMIYLQLWHSVYHQNA